MFYFEIGIVVIGLRIVSFMDFLVKDGCFVFGKVIFYNLEEDIF